MRTLAAALGVKFRPEAGGEIAHSAVSVVCNSDGVARHRQVGLQASVEPLVAEVGTRRTDRSGSRPARCVWLRSAVRRRNRERVVPRKQRATQYPDSVNDFPRERIALRATRLRHREVPDEVV